MISAGQWSCTVSLESDTAEYKVLTESDSPADSSLTVRLLYALIMICVVCWGQWNECIV
jgi:hypothetical protein